eukprot:TRINITY_DN16686_c0_g2_i1.p1 TRINITY_DN16686_c0_g2~~TRINITY_DN16686_c0_g2_i1.p1  ORF type:complete len:757 (+),score=108.24 TRINITY_DN16686_c0_g2_i1:194-2464(+)
MCIRDSTTIVGSGYAIDSCGSTVFSTLNDGCDSSNASPFASRDAVTQAGRVHTGSSLYLNRRNTWGGGMGDGSGSGSGSRGLMAAVIGDLINCEGGSHHDGASSNYSSNEPHVGHSPPHTLHSGGGSQVSSRTEAPTGSRSSFALTTIGGSTSLNGSGMMMLQHGIHNNTNNINHSGGLLVGSYSSNALLLRREDDNIASSSRSLTSFHPEGNKKNRRRSEPRKSSQIVVLSASSTNHKKQRENALPKWRFSVVCVQLCHDADIDSNCLEIPASVNRIPNLIFPSSESSSSSSRRRHVSSSSRSGSTTSVRKRRAAATRSSGSGNSGDGSASFSIMASSKRQQHQLLLHQHQYQHLHTPLLDHNHSNHNNSVMMRVLGGKGYPSTAVVGSAADEGVLSKELGVVLASILGGLILHEHHLVLQIAGASLATSSISPSWRRLQSPAMAFLFPSRSRSVVAALKKVVELCQSAATGLIQLASTENVKNAPKMGTPSKSSKINKDSAALDDGELVVEVGVNVHAEDGLATASPIYRIQSPSSSTAHRRHHRLADPTTTTSSTSITTQTLSSSLSGPRSPQHNQQHQSSSSGPHLPPLASPTQQQGAAPSQHQEHSTANTLSSSLQSVPHLSAIFDCPFYIVISTTTGDDIGGNGGNSSSNTATSSSSGLLVTSSKNAESGGGLDASVDVEKGDVVGSPTRKVHTRRLQAADAVKMAQVIERGTSPRAGAVSYTHLRAHETPEHLVCRLLLEKKKKFVTTR